MTSHTNHDRPRRQPLPGAGPTDDDLRYDVELTREELANTVVALTHKMNVKHRLRHAAERRLATATDTATRLAERTGEQARSARRALRRKPAIAGGAVLGVSLALAITWLAWKHR